MRPALAQRELALAAIGVLAVVIVLALSVGRAAGGKTDTQPQPVLWYSALAAPYAPSLRERTSCGLRVDRGTFGIAHPVLPCGVKVFLSYGGTTVLTQVIDKGPAVPGRAFDVTKALADRIGLHGVQPIRWAYAR